MVKEIDKGKFPQRVYRHPCPILVDKRVSLKAIGLWVYMLSKPPGWDFAAERVAWENKDGVRSICTAWEELIYLGYIKRRKLPNGREHYELYDEQYGAGAPYEGDYDFEISEEFSPWREDCWSTLCSAGYFDSNLSKEKFYEHLNEIEGIEDSTAWDEAEDWVTACKEGHMKLTWRNARKWTEHVKGKYLQTQTAKTADISI
jgi:hypothetical protein